MTAERSPCPGAGTPEFHRRGGALWCEDVPVAALAVRFGTPLYVYSKAAMAARLGAVRRAFGDTAIVCYAVKANGNLSLLRAMHDGGAGFDVVSGGELRRLQIAGLPTERVVFAGVAKERWEIEAAAAAGILFFNIESPHELPMLAAVGASLGAPLRVALRLNPDVDAGTHAYISTGKKENKFGISLARAGEVVEAIAREPWLQLVGYHVHLGSQLQSVQPYEQALQRVLEFTAGAPARRDGITHYDLGGGFGIGYGRGDALDVGAVARALLPLLAGRGWRPVVEPGRFLVGDAGMLLTRVLGEKRQGPTEFVLVDAAMNDLLRPALYQAEHAIVAVAPRAGEPRTVDVVGPVCETGDFLGKHRSLEPLVAGDLLAILAAGAYGASMASNYNSRRRPAEVLIDGATARLIRTRETFEQLVANETESHDPIVVRPDAP
jgi:diaminopimelate decarboxylase